MRQRRRAERQLSARPAPQVSAARRINQRFLQRLLYWAGGLFIVLLLAGLAVGWFFNFYQPPRKVVAEIDGVEFQLRDVVPYTLLDGTATGQLRPNFALNNLIRDSILEARGPDLGASIAPQDVEGALVQRFEQLDAEAESPAQLTDAGQSSLDAFTDALGVSENDYRDWVRGQLWQNAVYQAFLEETPSTAESVFVEWIVGADSQQARTAFDRIAAGEDFTAVANELNTDLTVADPDGVVGWTPRGALPEIDPLVFAENLAVNQVIGPVATSIGSIVYRVTDRSPDQPVDEAMRALLAQNTFQEWMDAQTAGLFFNLTADDNNWVLRSVGAI